MNEEKSILQHRFDAIVAEAVENGFTEEQAKWLINLLNEYIPIV